MAVRCPPRTAIKTANSLLRWLRWSASLGYQTWPPSAAALRTFLVDGGTRACGALLEALRFCRHVFRMPLPDETIHDPILVGRCNTLLAERSGQRQARPLRMLEVIKLEKFVTEDHDPWDKYLVGCGLFALFSRSRWSDLVYMDELFFDRSDDYPPDADSGGEPYGFVEGRARTHKAATSIAKKRKQMPVVAPLLGVTAIDWTVQWAASMEAIGFNPGQVSLGALCRAPLPSGDVSRAPCTSQDIGEFLNKVLGVAEDDLISSQSVSDDLGLGAKFGIAEPARLLLRHHSVGGIGALQCTARISWPDPSRFTRLCWPAFATAALSHATRSGSLGPEGRAIATQAGCPATPMAHRVPATPEVSRVECEVAEDYEASETRDPAPVHEEGVEDAVEFWGHPRARQRTRASWRRTSGTRCFHWRTSPRSPGVSTSTSSRGCCIDLAPPRQKTRLGRVSLAAGRGLLSTGQVCLLLPGRGLGHEISGHFEA